MIPKKFKVWDVEDKSMLMWIDVKNLNACWFRDILQGKHGYIPLQYTGLCDDFDALVCEADVIEFEGEPFVLQYGWYGDKVNKTNEFGWYLKGIQCEFKYVGGGKVIGNFYENGNLLNES